MNCSNCGTPLPENAKFCLSCGTPVAGAARAPPPPPAPTASAEPEAMKCPACGAALSPVFGEMVITCSYCGGVVALAGAGWKEISKHTMLVPTVGDAQRALDLVRANLDIGLLHRHDFEESKIAEQKLSFVPFWVIPASATTNYVYSDVAVGVGSTVATVAAAELLGAALGGRRGGFMPVPIMTGPPVNPNRSKTLTGMYEYPVVAVKGMTAYQPRNYEFPLKERTFFDRKSIPDGTPILNGDLGEDAAQHAAQSYVMQLQSDQAHHEHSMVNQIHTDVQVSEGELVHVPVWYFLLDRKGAKSMVLVDAHSAKVIPTLIGPT
ncbi:MAG TPA: zinc ribbon domain-containing protein [Thermoplasmata archaeon]|nr:zinc ribbon domain-containing protein [Thermoplasmata archaeon]